MTEPHQHEFDTLLFRSRSLLGSAKTFLPATRELTIAPYWTPVHSAEPPLVIDALDAEQFAGSAGGSSDKTAPYRLSEIAARCSLSLFCTAYHDGTFDPDRKQTGNRVNPRQRLDELISNTVTLLDPNRGLLDDPAMLGYIEMLTVFAIWQFRDGHSQLSTDEQTQQSRLLQGGAVVDTSNRPAVLSPLETLANAKLMVAGPNLTATDIQNIAGLTHAASDNALRLKVFCGTGGEVFQRIVGVGLRESFNKWAETFATLIDDYSGVVEQQSAQLVDAVSGHQNVSFPNGGMRQLFAPPELGDGAAHPLAIPRRGLTFKLSNIKPSL